MALPRYKPSEVRLDTGAGIGQRAVAQTYQTLSQKMNEWSDYTFKQGAEIRQREGREQAFQDTENEVEFTPHEQFSIYDKTYNNVRSATYSAKKEIDIADTSTDFALQFQDSPQEYNKAMDEYSQNLIKDAPTAELRASIKLSASKNKESTLNKLLIAENQRTRKDDVATFKQSWDLDVAQLVSAESLGNTDEALAVRNKNLTYLHSMIQNGLIQPSKAQELIQDAEYRVKKGVLEKDVIDFVSDGNFEEANKVLVDFNKEIPKDLKLEQYKNIQTSLSSLYNKAYKKQKAEQGAVNESNKIAINNGIKILNDGRLPNDIHELDELITTQSKTLQNKYKIAKDVNAFFTKNAELTLSEIKTIIDKKKGKRVSAYQNEVLNGLEEMYNKKKSLAKTDAMTYAESTGVEIEPIALTNLDALEKRRWQSINASKETGQPQMILKKDEATAMATVLDSPATTVEDKLAYIKEISEKAAEDSDIVFNQLSKSGAKNFGFVGHLANIKNAKAATYALKGFKQDIPIEEGLKKGVNDLLGGIFVNSDDFKMIQSGIFDYIKGRTIDGDAPANAKDILEATLGQVEEYNGHNVIRPFNMDESVFEHKLDYYVVEGNEKLTDVIQDITDWSGSGTAQLHYAGNGKYLIYRIDNFGKPYYEGNEDGTNFILEIK